MGDRRFYFRTGTRGKILIQLLILPWLLTACATAPTKNENIFQAQQKYREAVKFGNLKMRDKMYDGLKEAVRLDPEEPLYHFELGSAYFTDSRFEEAEVQYLATLKLQDNFVEAYRRLGRLYMSQGKWDYAIDYFKDVLKRSGVNNPHQVHNWLAISYYAQGNINLAEKAWRGALNVKENSQIRLNLALAYKANERYNLAIKSLEKAVELEPELIRAHFELAQLYLKANKKSLAKKHFGTVIELEPLSKEGKSSQEYLRLIPSEK